MGMSASAGNCYVRAVLGIDAAWTEREPSGVALVVDEGSEWTLLAVAPSYLSFGLQASRQSAVDRPWGSVPDVSALLKVAKDLGGYPVDLVAIDMPLSREPILARRVSDNLVSTAYGARQCGTHTPSAKRPGRLSDEFRHDFGSAGYPLQTSELCCPGIIEVYPHPALVELASAAKRLPYKHTKVRAYWSDLGPQDRRLKLLEVWKSVLSLLDTEIKGVTASLELPPISARGYEMKAFEDMLDAIVCAWVGIRALEGDAMPYGDETSAVWIPSPRT